MRQFGIGLALPSQPGTSSPDVWDQSPIPNLASSLGFKKSYCFAVWKFGPVNFTIIKIFFNVIVFFKNDLICEDTCKVYQECFWWVWQFLRFNFWRYICICIAFFYQGWFWLVWQLLRFNFCDIFVYIILPRVVLVGLTIIKS